MLQQLVNSDQLFEAGFACQFAGGILSGYNLSENANREIKEVVGRSLQLVGVTASVMAGRQSIVRSFSVLALATVLTEFGETRGISILTNIGIPLGITAISTLFGLAVRGE